MPPDVTGNFSAAGGVAHMDCVLEVEFFGKSCEVVGVSIHLVAIPGLGGTAVPSPVSRDDSIATLAEEQHLPVPVVRRERPTVTEHYGLARSPVLVINLRTVFRANGWHCFVSYRLPTFTPQPGECCVAGRIVPTVRSLSS